MKVLRALKDAYLNRRILIVIFQVIVQWFACLWVSNWLTNQFVMLISGLIPFIDDLQSYLMLILILWMTIGCFFYPVSYFYWQYYTRDRSLDNVSDEMRYRYLSDKDFYANWRRTSTGCLGTLFYLAWDLGKFIFVGQLLALTWLPWVKNTVSHYY